MKFYFISIIFIASILLSSCASILSPSSQEVTFKSPNKAIKVTVDSGNASKEGTEVKAILKKDLKAKQIVCEADGYKKEYMVAVQNRTSPFHYLSYLTWFGSAIIPPHWIGLALGYMIPAADNADCSWDFQSEHNLKELQKYSIWDSTQKRVYFKNVSFNIKKNDIIHNVYLNSFKKGDKPYKSFKLDSAKYSNTIFQDNMEDVLKKIGYIDTSNTVFFDNLNTLSLRCNVNSVTINEVLKLYYSLQFGIKDQADYVHAKVGTEWVLEDIYGDTLYKSVFDAPSGFFSIDFLSAENALKSAIADAIESTMVRFMNTEEVKNYFKSEKIKSISFDNLSITKPLKIPADIEQALQASVTIKTKDSHGSGFLISNDGYIITNHHVINTKTDYTVVTSDGSEYKANVIRSDKALDLALIKVEGNFEYAFNIPFDKNYKIGQSIFAIGTPRSVELGQSVSKGVISSTRKYQNYNYIQSDVAVNGGNSGGPIVNEQGELMSVVQWKIFGLGTEGISFSIPATDIMKSLGLSYR